MIDPQRIYKLERQNELIYDLLKEVEKFIKIGPGAVDKLIWDLKMELLEELWKESQNNAAK